MIMRNNRVRKPSSDIKIDVANLESEVIEQPSLYLHYSDLYAEAIEARDDAKQRLELRYSQVESKIRDEWDLYFKEKPTEPAIKGKILQDSSYRKAQKALNNANKTVNVMKGIVTSFEHRKKAIESAVSLRIGGFYSEPRKRQIQKQGGNRKTLKKRILKK